MEYPCGFDVSLLHLLDWRPLEIDRFSGRSSGYKRQRGLQELCYISSLQAGRCSERVSEHD